MHGKGASKKSGGSEASGETEKSNVRTTQNNIMNKADEILGGVQNGGGQTINIVAQNGGNITGNTKQTPAWIKGAASLAGKYGVSGVKAIGSGALRTAATATGTMLGFAGGVAKGDISEALKGAAAGGAIGNGLASNGIRFASNLGENIKNVGNDIQDTWNEGAYGTEYAQNIRMVRAFKQTSGYIELRKKFGDQLTDEKLSEILQAAKKEQEKNR
ncbi:MAG: hypothetical protein ACI4U9_02760 [Clostridia bacterium]